MRIPSALSLQELQVAFRDVHAIVAALGATTPYDWKGRRLIALADGRGDQDAATVAQLTAAIADLREELTKDETGEGPLVTGPIRVATFAQRGAAAAHRQELFIASDRNYVTWVSTGSAWQYLAGTHRGTLSPDTKPTGLTTSDVGYLFHSTDYNRTFRWDGSAWTDAPGAPPRHQITHFFVAPSPSAGWQLCDGSTVNRTATDGTLTAVTVPNLTTGKRFLRAHTSSGASGGSATTHTHSVDPPNTTSDGPSTSTTGAPSGTTEVQAGTGSTVASDGHTHSRSETHDVNVASFTSGAPSGSGGDDALPPYYEAIPYYRM